MTNLRATVASVSDRENVVFEIWCGNREVAEISREPGCDYEIELYPAPDGGAWHLNLNELKSMIDAGVKELADNS